MPSASQPARPTREETIKELWILDFRFSIDGKKVTPIYDGYGNHPYFNFRPDYAGWNLMTKKDNPSGAFFLVGTAMATGLMLPGLIYFGPRIPLIPGSVWLLLIITGFSTACIIFPWPGPIAMAISLWPIPSPDRSPPSS